ncbi:MAG: type II toxin-antitoxin system HipA family toxin [Spirochaeta sp.]|nr:type II toxin-antitoxin system HipA family toxin [Spirochaeta sp.]
MNTVVEVTLWGTAIGHLGYAPGQTEVATFEYDPVFARSGVQIAPITMPNGVALHAFDDTATRTFKGLPGIFADSLPDKYGNQLIDLYMAEKSIPPESITALDRLLYVGTRGMGALEYHPAFDLVDETDAGTALDIHLLAELADHITSRSSATHAELLNAKNRRAALRLIRVGSSAGGARSKALVARAADGTLFDGSIDHGPDFTYWILKFDTESNDDGDASDPKGMPKVEYIYSLIAEECGIQMPRTDYVVDGDDLHFLTERFDRLHEGEKITKMHYGSWAGLAHADRDPVGSNSYEQLVLLARQLGLGQNEITQLYRRAVFNVVGRNQDDHTKNFGFLMDKTGRWTLAPAFDLTYQYDPAGKWTRAHQTRLNRKRENFERSDLVAFGRYCNLSDRKSDEIVSQTIDAFSRFPTRADEYDVSRKLATTVETGLRLNI